MVLRCIFYTFAEPVIYTGSYLLSADTEAILCKNLQHNINYRICGEILEDKHEDK